MRSFGWGTCCRGFRAFFGLPYPWGVDTLVNMSHYPPAWGPPPVAAVEHASPGVLSFAAPAIMNWIALAAMVVGGTGLLAAVTEFVAVAAEGNLTQFSGQSMEIIYLALRMAVATGGGALAWGGWLWKHREARSMRWVQWGAMSLIALSVMMWGVGQVQTAKYGGAGLANLMSIPRILDSLLTMLGGSAFPILLLVLSHHRAVREYMLHTVQLSGAAGGNENE